MLNALVVKILAVGLTLSQLFTQPVEQFKPAFNAQTDRAEITRLLNAGCKVFMKEFEAEEIDFEPLFKMLIGAAKAQATKAQNEAEKGATPTAEPAKESFTQKLMKQIDLPRVEAAYLHFCKGQEVDQALINLDEVVDFYNKALADLPDHTKLKGMKLKEASELFDENDVKFTEVYSDDNRRRWVPISQLPEHVKQAFIAAEDKNFFKHHGLDIHGIVRAFTTGMSSSKGSRPQGGSTITQQVVKNLVLNDDLTFERKMREMVIATRVEKLMSKEEILELYLNYVFLGRASWGVEMAAQSYFGKSARLITAEEAAFLAGLTKGPNYFHPDRYPDRAKERRSYVLERMMEDKYITEEQYKAAKSTPMSIIAYEPPRTKGGFHFIDEINRQVRKLLKIPSLTTASYKVYSTLNSELQKATDRALQDGLYQYEVDAKNVTISGAQGSIAKEIQKNNSTWQQVLPRTRPKLFDVQWPIATVLQSSRGRVMVGLADGRTMPLTGTSQVLNKLKLYDLVHVNISEGKKGATAQLRLPTKVQGAVVVIENRTGKVLAMSGGFSYAQTQFNRVTQAARQTGSTLKPFIYLAALQRNFQPNTLIPDAATSFPPINKGGDWWTPKNYDGGTRGLVSMRQAIEKSLNLPTARIMKAMGPPGNPAVGLDYIQGVTKELGIYKEVERYYPFVLGAQPARLIDMAVAYATVANDGLKPTPHFIDKMVKDGQVVYDRRENVKTQPVALNSVDRVSFYQLRRLLEGTLRNGTAKRLNKWAGIVAGKTGTSNWETDAWFVGFTNRITVAVWVGYDSTKVHKNLGGGFTGGKVALPIAEKVLEASFNIYAPASPLVGAPPEIKDYILEVPVDGRLASSGLDVFRLRTPKSRDPINSRTSVLNDQEMNYPLYSDNYQTDDDQTDFLYDNEYQTAVLEQTPDGERYQPGAEDMTEMWERRGRKVDPSFPQPVFFKGL